MNTKLMGNDVNSFTEISLEDQLQHEKERLRVPRQLEENNFLRDWLLGATIIEAKKRLAIILRRRRAKLLCEDEERRADEKQKRESRQEEASYKFWISLEHCVETFEELLEQDAIWEEQQYDNMRKEEIEKREKGYNAKYKAWSAIKSLVEEGWKARSEELERKCWENEYERCGRDLRRKIHY